MSLTKRITRITVGVRFERSFRVPDIAGSIVDRIIRDRKGPFSGKFTKVRDLGQGHELSSDKKSKDDDEYLRITMDDIVFSVCVSDGYEAAFDSISSSMLPYLEKEVFLANRIENVNRFGVIHTYHLPVSKGISSAIKGLTGNQVEDVSIASLAFSKKMNVLEGKAVQGVDDYKNVIYTFNQDVKGLMVDIDFQYIFDPMRQDISDCQLAKLLEEAKSFQDKKVFSWLKEYDTQQ